MRRQPGDLLAPETDRPAARLQRSGDDGERRGLPGAVRPDEAGERACPNAEGRPVDRLDAAEFLVKVLDREQGDARRRHRAALTPDPPPAPCRAGPVRDAARWA